VASSDRRTRRGSFAAFRRPIVTDLVFWLAAGFAVVAGLVIGGAVLLVTGAPESALGWLWPAGAFAMFGWMSFKLLAMGINTSRALEPSPEPKDQARVQSMEAGGRVAGAVLGKGVRKVVGGRGASRAGPGRAPAAPSSPSPTSSSAAAAANEPAPQITVDKAARVLGSMVGRRLGPRGKGGGS
jgi:hypothetical protein